MLRVTSYVLVYWIFLNGVCQAGFLVFLDHSLMLFECYLNVSGMEARGN